MRIGDCVRCGGGIGRRGTDLCHRCRAADREASRRSPCPRCGRVLRLRADTPLRHLFSNLHRLRRHRAPPHRHQVPALPSPTRRRRCQANLRPLWPPGPDPRTHRLVRHLLAAQARASTAAALRRVRPADAAVEQRALQPLLATPPGPGRQPSREPRLCAERCRRGGSCPSLPTRPSAWPSVGSASW